MSIEAQEGCVGRSIIPLRWPAEWRKKGSEKEVLERGQFRNFKAQMKQTRWLLLKDGRNGKEKINGEKQANYFQFRGNSLDRAT